MGSNGEQLLGVKNLTVLRGTRKILNKINFNLNQGDILILEGENGCGKSTLIEAIAKIIPTQSGKIDLNSSFGLTLQKNGINGDELVSERLTYAMMSANGDPSDVNSVLKHWDFTHRKSDLVSHLSFGLKRKISIIQGLMPGYCSKKPIFSLLDEPTEGLDQKSVELLTKDLLALANLGHGFIIATHDSRITEIATRKCIIKDGGALFNDYELKKIENHELPNVSYKIGKINVAKRQWSKSISYRTKLPLLKRGLPLITSILVILGLILNINRDLIPANITGGLILLPGFLASLVKPAELEYLQEDRCGDWWKAMSNEPLILHTTIQEIIMILLAPLITSFLILNGTIPDDKILLSICSITIVLVLLANNSIYSLTENLPRKNATYVPLLTIILIWPFIISSNIILNDQFSNSINEVILVIIIPTLIYLVTPILSKK